VTRVTALMPGEAAPKEPPPQCPLRGSRPDASEEAPRQPPIGTRSRWRR
jgi:hypothetical protein